ncbi:serine hydrolase domain-containing protein [Saccharibacillus qingshengii]|uniref:serine hydrolase domain-containing protein n=1 Tax=Saccharibacillus qingshengii TaxID=1763540 RepID=UPI00155825A9|nr:serine hydrolase domain-containing protein [Saccharibacillus qingshengii]
MKRVQRLGGLLGALLLGSSIILSSVYAAPAYANAAGTPAAPSGESAVSPAQSWTPEQIDTYAEAAMQRLHIPGLAVGIVQDGKVQYTQGYGSAGPGAGPMTPQTPLAIGSTTKSFTALAIMQLVEEGKVDPEAPVTDYLPSFRLADPSMSAAITVSDLLHQTSGLSTYQGIAFLAKGKGTLMQHIADLADVPQKRPAGTAYEYSNLNYNILGAIVEQVSGLSYEEYIQQRIFAPIGMTQSFSSPERAKTAAAERSDLRPASGHQFLFGWAVPTRAASHTGTIPSGYLVSTAEDMSKYLIMQTEGGTFEGERLLSADNIAQMRKPAADMRDGSFYGMGWVVTGDTAGHNGTTENTYSEMRIRDGYGIFVLANSVDPLIVGYSGIMPGIDDILHGRMPSQESLPDFVKLYAIADGVAAVIALLFLWSLLSLLRWRKAFRPTGRRITLNFVLLFFCNIAFPLLLIRFVSRLAPWDVVVTWAPGIGWGMVALPWLLFITGGIKLVLMVRAMLTVKRPASSPAAGQAA